MSDQTVSDELAELIRNHASVARQEKRTRLRLVTDEFHAEEWQQLSNAEKDAQARLVQWKPATTYDALVKLSYLLKFAAESGKPLDDASLATILESVKPFDPRD